MYINERQSFTAEVGELLHRYKMLAASQLTDMALNNGHYDTYDHNVRLL